MFEIKEVHYPVLDWEGRTTEEGPRVKSKSFIVAQWDMTANGLPTMGDLADAVAEMKIKFPGRHKNYRIMGLPKPGDYLFGVEVA